MKYPKPIMRKSELMKMGFPEECLMTAYRSPGQDFAHKFLWDFDPHIHIEVVGKIVSKHTGKVFSPIDQMKSIKVLLSNQLFHFPFGFPGKKIDSPIGNVSAAEKSKFHGQMSSPSLYGFLCSVLGIYFFLFPRQITSAYTSILILFPVQSIGT